MPDNDNQHECVVTPQMIAAGDAAWQGGNLKDSLAAMYRAMRAAAPVEPSRTNEILRCCNIPLGSIVSPNCSDVTEDVQIALARAYIAEGRVGELEARLADATQRNLILRAAYDNLAQRPAAFVDPEPEPPKHNPYREFNTDRRRIGGA